MAMFPGKINDVILIAHLKTIEYGLAPVLDDPRRNVRKEAVDCLAAWSKVEDPKEDD